MAVSGFFVSIPQMRQHNDERWPFSIAYWEDFSHPHKSHVLHRSTSFP